MDPTVEIRHVLPDLWHHVSKPCKNGKVTLYDTASALEGMQNISAQGSILALVITLYISVLIRIIQVISRANIIIYIGLLGGRVQVLIPILAIILLWRWKQPNIFVIVCIILDCEGSLVDITVYIFYGEHFGTGNLKQNKFQKKSVKDDI